MERSKKNRQYYKFCLYGFLKNLRFFDAFFILFLMENGISFTQIGILYAAREISGYLFEVPSGLIADSFGRRSTLAGSFVLYIVSFILFFVFSHFWIYLVAFLLFGIGEAFRSGTHKGMIMDYLVQNGWQEHAVNYYGHTRSWSQLGSALSALMAGFIVYFGGDYQVIFLYSIIPYLLNFLLILSYPVRLNASLKPGSGKKRSRIIYAIKELLNNLNKKKLRLVIYSSATHSAYLKAVKDYIQVVMLNLALIIPLLGNVDQKQKNGLILGVLYFLIYMGTSFASKFAAVAEARKPGKIALLTLLLGFAAGTLSGISFILNLWFISLLFFAAIYLIENIRKPILTVAVAKQVPTEILSSVISSQTLLRTMLTSIMALVFGMIADRYGVGQALVFISGLLLLISTIIALSIKNTS